MRWQKCTAQVLQLQAAWVFPQPPQAQVGGGLETQSLAVVGRRQAWQSEKASWRR